MEACRRIHRRRRSCLHRMGYDAAMRFAVLAMIAACGRFHFDAVGGSGDAPTTFDGMLLFDAPTACLTPAPPTSCSTSSTGVTMFAASTFHMCAVRGPGVLTCWGNNDYGQLGFCGTGNVQVPT